MGQLDVGQKVRIIQDNFFGHKKGDIGTVVESSEEEEGIVIHIKEREGFADTCNGKGCVWYCNSGINYDYIPIELDCEDEELDGLIDTIESIIEEKKMYRTKLHRLLEDVYEKGKKSGYEDAVKDFQEFIGDMMFK